MWPDSAVKGSWEIYLGGYEPFCEPWGREAPPPLRGGRAQRVGIATARLEYVPAVAETFIYVVF